MKKFALTAIAALGMFVVSCSSSDPAEKAIDIINNAATEIKSAKSMEDIEKISKNLEKDLDALNLTEEEQKKLQESEAFKTAFSNLMQASMTKGMELGGGM